jgi:hypothetical protein
MSWRHSQKPENGTDAGHIGTVAVLQDLLNSKSGCTVRIAGGLNDLAYSVFTQLVSLILPLTTNFYVLEYSTT